MLRPPDGECVGGQTIGVDLVALAVERHAVHITCRVHDLGRCDREVELAERRDRLRHDREARGIDTEPLGDELDRHLAARACLWRGGLGVGRTTYGAEQGDDHDDRRQEPAARDQVTWGMGLGHAALLQTVRT